jgi:hypothetical protein
MSVRGHTFGGAAVVGGLVTATVEGAAVAADAALWRDEPEQAAAVVTTAPRRANFAAVVRRIAHPS